jgi:arsenate reductase (thioredoxin)
MSEPLRVLFVCSHNSARSQMAEGFLRALGGDHFAVESAGVVPGSLHPMAIQAMAEQGIDISLQRSKPVDDFFAQPFDIVVTVCDEANEACPVFPNARQRLHWSFPDPSRAVGNDEARFGVFELVRDDIRAHVEAELLTLVPQAA